MRKAILTACILAATGPLRAETFQIDQAHSSVSFRIRHFVTKVTGRFNKFDGSFGYDKSNPKAWTAQAKIDAASINTDNEGRDKHLRSSDFFDVEKCPTVEFNNAKVTGVKGDKATLHGDLTLHCVTKPVDLALEFGGTVMTKQGLKAGATATGTINRKDFGMIWNKALDTGGLMLGEDVEITIEVEGNSAEKKG
jgi:polyisoprenoid-binding protein YceI